MSQLNDGGKGSTQRPYNKEKYDNNYDVIFRKAKQVIVESEQRTVESQEQIKLLEEIVRASK